MLKLMPLLFAAALLYATPISAGGVGDDSWWGSGSDLVNIDIGQDPNVPGGVLVTATDDSGFSPPATGTEGTDSLPSCMTCSSCKTLTTPDGDKYCIGGDPSQVWKKNARGKWVKLKKVKAPKPKAGGKAPRSGNISWAPGDDVVALPH